MTINNTIIDLYTAVNTHSDSLSNEVDAICGPDAGDMPVNIQMVIINLRSATDMAIATLTKELQYRAEHIELQAPTLDIDDNDSTLLSMQAMF